MVDTAKFYLYLDEYRIDHEMLKRALDDYTIRTGRNGVEKIVGTLGNLRITEQRYVLQIEGSLPKFYHGHNYRPLTISELRDCIEMVSDRLHLPVGGMAISRIDLADCVEVSLRPKYYLDCLVSHPYLERTPRGTNGIYFENKSRHITFYGKTEERRGKKQWVPQEYHGRNWLRIENVHKKGTKYWFPFLDNISSLYDPDNYLATIDHWVREFDLIHKVDTNTGRLDSITDQMDYHKFLLLEGMKSRGGELAVLREMETLYDLGKYENTKSGKTKLRRQKKQVCDLFELNNRLDPDFRSIKKELCDKVHLQARRNREFLLT